MTTTVEELIQAERAAYEVYREADRAWRKAGEELRAGRLAACGLSGHVVSYKARWGYKIPPEYREVKFLVTSFNGRNVAGKVVRADGTIGTQTKDCPVENVTDHGPYLREATP